MREVQQVEEEWRGGVDVRDVLQKAKMQRGQKCKMDSNVSALNGSQLSR